MEAFQNGNCLFACSARVALRRLSFVDAFCALVGGVKVSRVSTFIVQSVGECAIWHVQCVLIRCDLFAMSAVMMCDGFALVCVRVRRFGGALIDVCRQQLHGSCSAWRTRFVGR